MKKKIRDLTIAETKRICDNNKCSSCPLFCTPTHIFCVMSEIPMRIPSIYWESEVEIPDEVFGISEQLEEEE